MIEEQKDQNIPAPVPPDKNNQNNYWQIKSWKIAATGCLLLFITPIFLIAREILMVFSGQHNEMAGMGFLLAFLFFIPALIFMIPAVLLMSGNVKIKKAGALLGIIFGTVLLIIARLLAGELSESSFVLSALLASLPGIFLFASGCYFFFKESEIFLLYDKSAKILIVFCITSVIFSWSIIKAAFISRFDDNPELKECQIKSIPGRISVGVLANLFGDKSYQPDFVCYNDIARKNLDVSLCEKLPIEGRGNVNIRDCMIYIAINKNDADICLKLIRSGIGSYFGSDFCFLQIAKSLNVSNLCEKTGDWKDSCYSEIEENKTK